MKMILRLNHADPTAVEIVTKIGILDKVWAIVDNLAFSLDIRYALEQNSQVVVNLTLEEPDEYLSKIN